MPPFLSVVVISHNMLRELPRTLESLSVACQKGIDRDDYEVVLIDNGSRHPPDQADFAALDLNLTVLGSDVVSPSPVAAINQGLRRARGEVIGVWIDGARMASPGLLANACSALRVSDQAFVGSRGRYLGFDSQSRSIRRGYSQTVEDQLLARSGWRENGYRLFEVSVFDESSGPTWFDPVAESNSLFMPRSLWQELGGYDPRFEGPGGGLVNLDTWTRACDLPGTLPIVLLGEATFHQMHGGVMTNSRRQRQMFAELNREYRAIRGHDYAYPLKSLCLWGRFTSHPPTYELSTGLMSRAAWQRRLSRWKSRASRLLSGLRQAD